MAFLCILMIAVTNAPYDGGLSLAGWAMTIVMFPVLTNVIAVMVGLPFRLHPRLRTVLRAHGGVPLLVAAAGVVAVLTSFALRVPDPEVLDGIRIDAFSLPPGLFWAGWLATAVGLVHATPPFALGRRRAGDAGAGDAGHAASGASRSLGA